MDWPIRGLLSTLLRACAGRWFGGVPAVAPVDGFGADRQGDGEGESDESVLRAPWVILVSMLSSGNGNGESDESVLRAPVGVAAELVEVRQLRVGAFDGPSQPRWGGGFARRGRHGHSRHCARSSLCSLIESRPRTPQHRSTSAVAQQRRSEWTCHSGLIWLNNPAHFDSAQRRPGCCASAGPDREALAVSVCRVGVCCSGPGWVQRGEMPNPPRPAGLGCSAAEGYVLGFAVGVLHGEFPAGSAGDLGAASGVNLLVIPGDVGRCRTRRCQPG